MSAQAGMAVDFDRLASLVAEAEELQESGALTLFKWKVLYAEASQAVGERKDFLECILNYFPGDDGSSPTPGSPKLPGKASSAMGMLKSRYYASSTPSSLLKSLRNPGHLRNLLTQFSQSVSSDLSSKIGAIDSDSLDSSADPQVLKLIDSLDYSSLPDQIQPYLRDMAIRGGLEALDSVQASTPETREELFNQAVELGKERAASIAGMRYKRGRLHSDPGAEYAINQTAKRELKRIYAKAKEEGVGPTELSERMRNAQAFSGQRMDLIADTEIHRSRHEGKIAGFKTAGIERLDWVLDPKYETGKEYPCACPALAAGSPYEIDSVPDLDHPRCLCTIRAHEEE